MNCTICNLPVVLSPSAAERAAKFGGSPDDYTRLFTEHAQCIIDQRKAFYRLPPVAEMLPTFQQLEMLRLRQRACRAYGVDAGSRETAERVNRMTQDELNHITHEKITQ